MTPDSGDYFACLGLPRRLRIDPADLERRFHERSRELHPDRFFGRPEAERRQAEQAAARLNDARRTLRDPVSRAEYLLELYEIRSDGQALAEEVFDARSALEEGRATPQETRRRVEQRLGEAARDLEAAFAGWDRDGSIEELRRIREILDRRSYLAKLLAEAQAP